MRLPVAAAALALLLPPAVHAEDPPVLRVPVGVRAVVGGYAGRCDDLSVATITLDANATITGLKAGSTVCSSQHPGGRQVWRVLVVDPSKRSPGDRPGDGKQGG